LKKETFEVTVKYGVKFTNKNPVPIAEIVSSLQAYEKLIKRTGPFIEKSFHGVQVNDIHVFVSNLESGSLIEDFLVKILFENKEDLEKFKESTLKLMNGKTLTAVVALGVGAYIGFGIHNALSSKNTAPNINAYNGAIVQLGGTMNISKEAMESILKGVRDKKSLIRESIGAVSPAFDDKDATVEIQDNPQLNISRGFIDESPEEYDPPQPSEIIKKYSSVDVDIYASDRDSNEKAWAGIVPGIVPNRVRFVLNDDIDPSKIHGKLRIKADIQVTSVLNKSKKEFAAKMVEIISIK
jgi:hypothetical protein